MTCLNHPFTCDGIDTQIGIAKGNLTTYAADLLKSYGIELTSREKIYCGEELFSAIEPVFEKVRNTNFDIRKASNVQLQKLSVDNLELRAKIYLLEKKIKELES